MGTEEQFNIFTAEATAFDLAAEIVKESPPNFTKCIIYPDSQAAIKSIVKPQKQLGQSIIISAIDNIESLQSKRTMTIKIAWIPGHRAYMATKRSKNMPKTLPSQGETPNTYQRQRTSLSNHQGSIQSRRPSIKNGTQHGKPSRTMPNNSAESQASVIPRRASNSTKPSTRGTMLPSWRDFAQDTVR